MHCFGSSTSECRRVNIARHTMRKANKNKKYYQSKLKVMLILNVSQQMVFHFLLDQNSERKSNRMHKLSCCLFFLNVLRKDDTCSCFYLTISLLSFFFQFTFNCGYTTLTCTAVVSLVTWSPVMEEAHYYCRYGLFYKTCSYVQYVRLQR